VNKNNRLKLLEEKLIPDGEWIPENKYLQKLLADIRSNPKPSEPFSLEAIWKQLREREL